MGCAGILMILLLDERRREKRRGAGRSRGVVRGICEGRAFVADVLWRVETGSVWGTLANARLKGSVGRDI